MAWAFFFAAMAGFNVMAGIIPASRPTPVLDAVCFGAAAFAAVMAIISAIEART